jgi:uncharacterized protein YqjF (DUF2071 family)
MAISAMTGKIERRILVNYRVDPEVLARVVPEPFRPQLVNGAGLAGICLIRLVQLRPHGLPPLVGMSSENAAHRYAVEWDGPDGPEQGVYIPRRDTSSRLTTLVGGRLFPGEHHRARFAVTEGGGHYSVAFESLDGTTRVDVDAHEAVDIDSGSVFDSVAQASAFFEAAALGYSATCQAGHYDGIALRCTAWRVEPLAVDRTRSSFFDDSTIFASGSTEFDSALLMRDIPATWQAEEPVAAVSAAGAARSGRPAVAPVEREQIRGERGSR